MLTIKLTCLHINSHLQPCIYYYNRYDQDKFVIENFFNIKEVEVHNCINHSNHTESFLCWENIYRMIRQSGKTIEYLQSKTLNIKNFLRSKGFTLIHKISCDKIFINHVNA